MERDLDGKTFLITGAGWFVSARIVEPRLGPYDERNASEDLGEQQTMEAVTKLERKGLLFAALSAVLAVLDSRISPIINTSGSWRSSRGRRSA